MIQNKVYTLLPTFNIYDEQANSPNPIPYIPTYIQFLQISGSSNMKSMGDINLR